MYLKEIWLQGNKFKTADSCRCQILLLQMKIDVQGKQCFAIPLPHPALKKQSVNH